MSADLVAAQNEHFDKMKANQLATMEFQAKMTEQTSIFNAAMEASKAAKNASNKLQG